eukprot:TRINITY_DN14507_c0_g1_i2.p1 TRINITY_DN14507_c0_g1~~TRINITY_DN14507_c0_g1_i2.p1  ORF type:complete len:3372 (+),score=518.72 TRINITY_DN14507_c0_g1_i2:1484-10117(+)
MESATPHASSLWSGGSQLSAREQQAGGVSSPSATASAWPSGARSSPAQFMASPMPITTPLTMHCDGNAAAASADVAMQAAARGGDSHGAHSREAVLRRRLWSPSPRPGGDSRGVEETPSERQAHSAACSAPARSPGEELTGRREQSFGIAQDDREDDLHGYDAAIATMSELVGRLAERSEEAGHAHPTAAVSPGRHERAALTYNEAGSLGGLPLTARSDGAETVWGLSPLTPREGAAARWRSAAASAASAGAKTAPEESGRAAERSSSSTASQVLARLLRMPSSSSSAGEPGPDAGSSGQQQGSAAADATSIPHFSIYTPMADGEGSTLWSSGGGEELHGSPGQWLQSRAAVLSPGERQEALRGNLPGGSGAGSTGGGEGGRVPGPLDLPSHSTLGTDSAEQQRGEGSHRHGTANVMQPPETDPQDPAAIRHYRIGTPSSQEEASASWSPGKDSTPSWLHDSLWTLLLLQQSSPVGAASQLPGARRNLPQDVIPSPSASAPTPAKAAAAAAAAAGSVDSHSAEHHPLDTSCGNGRLARSPSVHEQHDVHHREYLRQPISNDRQSPSREQSAKPAWRSPGAMSTLREASGSPPGGLSADARVQRPSPVPQAMTPQVAVYSLATESSSSFQPDEHTAPRSPESTQPSLRSSDPIDLQQQHDSSQPLRQRGTARSIPPSPQQSPASSPGPSGFPQLAATGALGTPLTSSVSSRASAAAALGSAGSGLPQAVSYTAMAAASPLTTPTTANAAVVDISAALTSHRTQEGSHPGAPVLHRTTPDASLTAAAGSPALQSEHPAAAFTTPGAVSSSYSPPQATPSSGHEQGTTAEMRTPMLQIHDHLAPDAQPSSSTSSHSHLGRSSERGSDSISSRPADIQPPAASPGSAMHGSFHRAATASGDTSPQTPDHVSAGALQETSPASEAGSHAAVAVGSEPRLGWRRQSPVHRIGIRQATSGPARLGSQLQPVFEESEDQVSSESVVRRNLGGSFEAFVGEAKEDSTVQAELAMQTPQKHCDSGVVLHSGQNYHTHPRELTVQTPQSQHTPDASFEGRNSKLDSASRTPQSHNGSGFLPIRAGHSACQAEVAMQTPEKHQASGLVPTSSHRGGSASQGTPQNRHPYTILQSSRHGGSTSLTELVVQTPQNNQASSLASSSNLGDFTSQTEMVMQKSQNSLASSFAPSRGDRGSTCHTELDMQTPQENQGPSMAPSSRHSGSASPMELYMQTPQNHHASRIAGNSGHRGSAVHTDLVMQTPQDPHASSIAPSSRHGGSTSEMELVMQTPQNPHASSIAPSSGRRGNTSTAESAMQTPHDHHVSSVAASSRDGGRASNTELVMQTPQDAHISSIAPSSRHGGSASQTELIMQTPQNRYASSIAPSSDHRGSTSHTETVLQTPQDAHASYIAQSSRHRGSPSYTEAVVQTPQNHHAVASPATAQTELIVQAPQQASSASAPGSARSMAHSEYRGLGQEPSALLAASAPTELIAQTPARSALTAFSSSAGSASPPVCSGSRSASSSVVPAGRTEREDFRRAFGLLPQRSDPKECASIRGEGQHGSVAAVPANEPAPSNSTSPQALAVDKAKGPAHSPRQHHATPEVKTQMRSPRNTDPAMVTGTLEAAPSAERPHPSASSTPPSAVSTMPASGRTPAVARPTCEDGERERFCQAFGLTPPLQEQANDQQSRISLSAVAAASTVPVSDVAASGKAPAVTTPVQTQHVAPMSQAASDFQTPQHSFSRRAPSSSSSRRQDAATQGHTLSERSEFCTIFGLSQAQQAESSLDEASVIHRHQQSSPAIRGEGSPPAAATGSSPRTSPALQQGEDRLSEAASLSNLLASVPPLARTPSPSVTPPDAASAARIHSIGSRQSAAGSLVDEQAQTDESRHSFGTTPAILRGESREVLKSGSEGRGVRLAASGQRSSLAGGAIAAGIGERSHPSGRETSMSSETLARSSARSRSCGQLTSEAREDARLHSAHAASASSGAVRPAPQPGSAPGRISQDSPHRAMLDVRRVLDRELIAAGEDFGVRRDADAMSSPTMKYDAHESQQRFRSPIGTDRSRSVQDPSASPWGAADSVQSAAEAAEAGAKRAMEKLGAILSSVRKGSAPSSAARFGTPSPQPSMPDSSVQVVRSAASKHSATGPASACGSADVVGTPFSHHRCEGAQEATPSSLLASTGGEPSVGQLPQQMRRVDYPNKTPEPLFTVEVATSQVDEPAAARVQLRTPLATRAAGSTLVSPVAVGPRGTSHTPARSQTPHRSLTATASDTPRSRAASPERRQLLSSPQGQMTASSPMQQPHSVAALLAQGPSPGAPSPRFALSQQTSRPSEESPRSLRGAGGGDLAAANCQARTSTGPSPGLRTRHRAEDVPVINSEVAGASCELAEQEQVGIEEEGGQQHPTSASTPGDDVDTGKWERQGRATGAAASASNVPDRQLTPVRERPVLDFLEHTNVVERSARPSSGGAAADRAELPTTKDRDRRSAFARERPSPCKGLGGAPRNMGREGAGASAPVMRRSSTEPIVLLPAGRQGWLKQTAAESLAHQVKREESGDSMIDEEGFLAMLGMEPEAAGARAARGEVETLALGGTQTGSKPKPAKHVAEKRSWALWEAEKQRFSEAGRRASSVPGQRRVFYDEARGARGAATVPRDDEQELRATLDAQTWFLPGHPFEYRHRIERIRRIGSSALEEGGGPFAAKVRRDAERSSTDVWQLPPQLAGLRHPCTVFFCDAPQRLASVAASGRGFAAAFQGMVLLFALDLRRAEALGCGAAPSSAGDAFPSAAKAGGVAVIADLAVGCCLQSNVPLQEAVTMPPWGEAQCHRGAVAMGPVFEDAAARGADSVFFPQSGVIAVLDAASRARPRFLIEYRRERQRLGFSGSIVAERAR